MENIIKAISTDEIFPILNSIGDAIFIDDKDGHAIWCNKASEELYRVTLADILGKHVSELEQDGVFSPSVASLVLKQKKELTIIHANKDGKRLLSTGTPIFDKSGTICKVITTSRDITELVTLHRRLDYVQNTLDELKSAENFLRHSIIANSEAMVNVLFLIKRLTDIDTTVLITGESGVGKGVIARLLHENGSRKGFPLVKVNCGAIPENLIESELFGYERGAFTGSRAEGKTGLFETAQKGTIFLDEISELSLNLQVKLLQVIQEREITRVGGTKSIPLDVRIISATNKDLLELVHAKKFREDLYYRLNVIPINLPPLRERREDIEPLITFYLDHYNNKLGCHKEITPEAFAMLMDYSWPGNVRELQNIIERLIITAKDSIIAPEHLPGFIRKTTETTATSYKTLRHALDSTEREVLLNAYEKYKSTRAVAKALNISQPSVVRKLKKYGIQCDTKLNQ